MILPMTGDFGRAAMRCLAICGVAALIGASPARADVMELGDNGARWVAGGQAASSDDLLLGAALDADSRPLAVEYAPDGAIDLSAMIVPDAALGDISTSYSGVPARYGTKIAELSQRFDLSPSLLEALVWQESRWRENAVSRAGARGLAQLMPGTARYLGVDPDDPMQNLEGGARYLREQLDRFDQDLEKALAAYNAGPGRVIRAGGIPNIRETKLYVAAIMGRLSDHARADAP